MRVQCLEIKLLSSVGIVSKIFSKIGSRKIGGKKEQQMSQKTTKC